MTIDQTPAYSKEFVDSLLKACVDYRSQVDQLERENAALREDKERLDWLEKQCVFMNLEHSPGVYSRFLTTRDEIDAERKEAQP